MSLALWIGTESKIRKRSDPFFCIECGSQVCMYNMSDRCFHHAIDEKAILEGILDRRARIKKQTERERKRRMKNSIPPSLADKVVTRPQHLGERGAEKYTDLATTLELLDAQMAVEMSVEEAERLYGKCYKTTVVLQMKKRGIKKIKLAHKNNRVYMWATKV